MFTGFPRPTSSSAGGFSNFVVLTSTQSWTCPAGVTRAEVTVQDGGQGGKSGGGLATNFYQGGTGGNAGVSILTLTPGAVYTATVGAGGAVAISPAAGGASSFAGPGLTTLTSANASFKVPGGTSGFYADNTMAGNGGGTLLAPPASTGYGAGGHGGDGTGGGTAGQNGAVIIRY